MKWASWHLISHWSWVTHVCVSKLTIIDSDNGLSPGRRQAIIWTNDRILLTGSLGTNFSEILIGIQTFPFKKMHLKMSSAKWRPFCLGLNVLTHITDTCTLYIYIYIDINIYRYIYISEPYFSKSIKLFQDAKLVIVDVYEYKFLCGSIRVVISNNMKQILFITVTS